MKKNNEQIEKKAVRILEDVLESSSSIQTFFDSNDKTPIFDGSIFLYDIKEGANRTKESFNNEIKVQIKGTTNKRINRNNKFSIDKSDLLGFKRIGGGLFFVVYIDFPNKTETIFYKDLLPFDLQNVEENKSNKISLKFKRFPVNIDGIITVLKTFILHRSRQSPEILNLPLNNLDGKQLTTTFIGRKEYIESNQRELLSQEPILYYKNESGLSIPAGRIIADSVYSVKEVDAKLYDGKKLKSYITIKNEDEAEINIEEFLFLNIHKESVKITFTISRQDTLDQIISVLRKMDNIIRFGIYINDYLFKIDKTITENSDETFDETFNNIKSQFIDLDRIFTKLKIDKNLNYFEMSDKEIDQLTELVHIYKGHFPDEAVVRTISVLDNLYYLLITDKDIHNMFYINDEIFIRYILDDEEGETYPSLVPFDNLEKVADYNYKHIFEDIERIFTANNKPYSYINQYLLNTISTYDRSKQEEFYQLSELIAELLLDKEKSTVNYINYFQVILRKRKLSKVEKNLLYDLLDDSQQQLETVSIGILLGENVTNDIKTLKKEDEDVLKTWPIYNLI